MRCCRGAEASWDGEGGYSGSTIASFSLDPVIYYHFDADQRCLNLEVAIWKLRVQRNVGCTFVSSLTDTHGYSERSQALLEKRLKNCISSYADSMEPSDLIIRSLPANLVMFFTYTPSHWYPMTNCNKMELAQIPLKNELSPIHVYCFSSKVSPLHSETFDTF
ncbi:hypothetical protein EJB05_45460, partial [Eragrostis curvula]